jgi:AAA domain
LLALLTVLSISFSEEVNKAYNIRVCMETYGSKAKGIKCNIRRDTDLSWKKGILAGINSGDRNLDWSRIKNNISEELLRKATNSPHGFLPRFFGFISDLFGYVDVRFAPGTTCTGVLQTTAAQSLMQFDHIKIKRRNKVVPVESPGIADSEDHVEDVNSPVLSLHGGRSCSVFNIAGSMLPHQIAVNTLNFSDYSREKSATNPFEIEVHPVWLRNNSSVEGLRSQVYNGSLRMATGEIRRGDKQSFRVLNLGTASGSVSSMEGNFTNIEVLKKSVNDFHLNAKQTLSDFCGSPARFEMLCSGIPKSATTFTYEGYVEVLKAAVCMIVDVYSLQLVKGYDINVYRSLVEFSLAAMRGFATATLQLTQVSSSIGDLDASMNEFALAHSAIRSAYLTYWSGRMEQYYSFAAQLQTVLCRTLLPPGEVLPHLFHIVKTNGGSDKQFSKFLSDLNCDCDIFAQLSTRLSSAKETLTVTTLSRDCASLYEPAPSPGRSRVCNLCWRIFTTDTLSKDETWTVPDCFFYHPCYERPSEERLVSLSSAIFSQKLDEMESRLDVYQRLVLEHIHTRNIIYCAPAGTGKSHTGNLVELILAKRYGGEAIIKVSPTWNSAVAARAVTWHQFFKFGIESYEVYCLVHQLADSKENIKNVKTFINKYYLKGDRSADVVRIIRNAVLIQIDEFGRLKRDIFEMIHLIFCEIRQCYSQLFGGCRVLLLGDPSQCAPESCDKYYAELGRKFHPEGVKQRFNIDGFGFCFESPLFSCSLDFGRFLWIIVRSDHMHRFDSEWLRGFSLRARQSSVEDKGIYSFAIESL